MADLLKGLFGGEKPVATPASDDDFADFAEAPNPSPASISAMSVQPVGEKAAIPTGAQLVPYTKWYRVWERTQLSDFQAEAVVLPFIILIVGLHIWGRRGNRRKAKNWISVHAPELYKEYASVGFASRKAPSSEDSEGTEPLPTPASGESIVPDDLMQEKTASEYLAYATGRQNVAFIDFRILLYKRYNPATLLVEFLLSLLIESVRSPREGMLATAYPFDGREYETIPAKSQEQLDAIQAQGKSKSSVYDNFIWAVVHKEHMKTLRDERYDLSLTVTRDSVKLPSWATVMTESAEITDQLLTNDLIKAVENAGDAFEYLVLTDQPIDKPQSLADAKSKKRISLGLSLPSGTSESTYASTLPIFRYYLRLPDVLASSAHFRPEVRRKIANAREEEQRKLKKVDEDEKAEERRLESEKKKKEVRDSRLKGMSAEDQRKFLEKERERSGKKQEKKMMRKA